MPGKGFPPKPTKMKELAGNPGQRRLNEHEPKPRRGKVVCPSWLSKAARAEWKRIVPELDRLGILTHVDRVALAAYCQATAELEEATEILNREGRIITVPIVVRNKQTGEEKVVGEKKAVHPATRVQKEAYAHIRQFITEFGLTPSSRSRIHATPQEEERDPFEELMNRAASGSQN